MDLRTSTVEITELANQELEGFVTCTLCKLIELEEEELKAESSLRLSACVNVGVMQDEAGKLGYFVNEVEWGISTCLYSRSRAQNALSFADTYYPLFVEWVQRSSRFPTAR